MTATNHAAAGALIALTIKEPGLVLPLAFISHFVMDALPHFGYPGNKGYGEALKHKLTYSVILLDIIGLTILIWFVAGANWLTYAAGITALLPDFAGLYDYFGIERKKKHGRSNSLIAKLHKKYHRRLEWCERPWSLFIEVLLATLLLFLIHYIK